MIMEERNSLSRKFISFENSSSNFKSFMNNSTNINLFVNIRNCTIHLENSYIIKVILLILLRKEKELHIEKEHIIIVYNLTCI